MGETALNFGPDWIRALANEDRSTSPEPPVPPIQPPTAPITTVPKYSLAKFRYGREEMLALIPKDPKQPDCLKRDTCKIVKDTFSQPLALTPITEEEQRLMSRSWNSDAVLRASGKSGPGNPMGRGGRGGSVDRGRGRGRGGYYQRGATYEDSDDGPPSFSRPKPIERSQSASEKDQRWDDRDRRFDRPYSGRGGGMDDNTSKLEHSRSYHSQEHWRKYEKDGESDWRSVSGRSTDKLGARGSWRTPIEKESRDIERNPSSRSLNGNTRGSHSAGNHFPEWSVDEVVEQDVVGTFDSSGAFLETKMANEGSGDIYVSDDADEETGKDSPEAKKGSPRKTPKKISPPPQAAAAATTTQQNILKQTNSPGKGEEPSVEKHPPKKTEPPSGAKILTNLAVSKSADHVIKPNNSVQHHNVNSQKLDNKPIVLPNVPEVVEENTTKTEHVILEQRKTVVMPTCAAIEEEAFAHHKKATENMVAQWTEEEEQRVISQAPPPPVLETETKWFYQDPQMEIQGPFKSSEMLEWFSAGYFTMSLMVRRTCDEKFSQLGDLIKAWGRVPFMPGNSPPPIRAPPMTTSLPTAPTQTIVPNPAAAAPVTSQIPKQDEQLMALQQQLLQQQLMQQQLMLRQAQLQQLFSQLKQQDNFASLNSQQQQQVLMQQFMAQQQMPRPNLSGASDQPNPMDPMTPLPLHLLSLPMAPLLKNDMSLWNVGPAANPWPMNVNASQPTSNSIWDIDTSKQSPDESDLEKQKRLAEDQEKLRRAEEDALTQEKELEERRKLEELRRRQEEEKLLKELQKQEEEKKRLEELKRQEEEMRRQELKRLEEQRQREEELRRQEELRKIEEQKMLEELKRQEEKRLAELKRKEDERRQEEARRQEQKKLEEKRKKEELQKMLEMEQEHLRIEQEKQKEAERLKEIEREQQIQRERQKQREEEMRRLAEIKLKSQGPAWGMKTSQSDSQLSLADIQRLQEEKERQEREEQKERIRQLQMQQQLAAKQVQQAKNSLSWAKRSVEVQPAVKSLAEIQQEEAERLAQQQKFQKPQAPAPVVNSNVGVWGNASHRITAAPPSWNLNNVTTSGFWDDALSSTQSKKQQTVKSNDSAFPALSNLDKPATTTVHSNKSKNVRAKKEEDAIKKLFGNRKPTDEFTIWCTEALSTMPSSVDVPTFVAFLKDIESPYEVHDYVKSYLGDGKEPREFAKQFLEKRSKFRAKQTSEDNSLWGPAPAITPVVNKTVSQPLNDNDGNSNSKGKTKRRKNRMQKMDSSMLGFTVQPNPDRLNAGEIDHIEM